MAVQGRVRACSSQEVFSQAGRVLVSAHWLEEMAESEGCFTCDLAVYAWQFSDSGQIGRVNPSVDHVGTTDWVNAPSVRNNPLRQMNNLIPALLVFGAAASLSGAPLACDLMRYQRQPGL